MNLQFWRRKGRTLFAKLKARWGRLSKKDDESPNKTCEVDQIVIYEAYNQAVIARNKGQRRLALLLAHQCECVAGDPLPPEIAEFIADLRGSIVAN